MPLPNDFSHAEHLQDTLKKTMNRQVRDYFRDVGDDDWQPDTSTPRASLRTACTHQEADTLDMTVLRCMTFYLVVGQLQNSLYIPSETGNMNPKVIRRSQPKITLHFKEDWNDVEPGYDRLAGEISFRLMNHTTTSITEAEARQYGQRIKTLFGANKGFVWRKGRIMASYSDWAKGYQLQLLVRDKAEGKRLVEQVLDINQHTPDWEFFETKENDQASEAYPIVPPSETILGKRVRLPRRRPVSDVRFEFAILKLAGVLKQPCLYDRSFKFKDAYVKD
jgi:hypothetical protein